MDSTSAKTLNDRAVAWLAVCDALTSVAPGWQGDGKNGMEAAVSAIRALAGTPIPQLTAPAPQTDQFTNDRIIEIARKTETAESRDGDYILPISFARAIESEVRAHAGVAAEPKQPTDISQRLREYADNPGYSHNDYADTMRIAAGECERFYGGMMNWKANAQAKDKTIIDLRDALKMANARLAELTDSATIPAQAPAVAPAQTSTLVPKWAGSFHSYQDWVNKAQTRLASPDHRRAICVDAKGRRCALGGDFAQARNEGAFPVRYFWECELVAQAPAEVVLSQAAQDVLAERRRQVEQEGWTPEGDDAYDAGELSLAASCYALAGDPPHARFPDDWPWDGGWWKPADDRRNLVKAGALILADIERLDRLTHQSTANSGDSSDLDKGPKA